MQSNPYRSLPFGGILPSNAFRLHFRFKPAGLPPGYWSVAGLLFLLCFSACRLQHDSCGPHPNPYGLEIVHCKKEYLVQIRQHPDLEMKDLEKEIPGLITDLRYATPNNFTGQLIYSSPRAFARKKVADALRQVQDSLRHHGLGLIVFDAYRPYSASVRFFEVYPDTLFVANPRYGSRHNRGAAVDVSLADLATRKEIAMPSGFDDFSEKAHPGYNDLPPEIIQNRNLLFGVMKHFGFTHYPTEWWHFDFAGWEQYPLTDLPFGDLE